jgi:hypothetical protein
MALTKATYRMTSGAQVNIFDYIPQNLHSGIKDFTTTTPVHTYIQQAMDDGAGSIYFPMGKYVVLAPIFFNGGESGSTQASNLIIIGENRTSTYLWVDTTTGAFAASAGGTKATFINQANNGKLSFRNIRWQGDISGGYGIYALEGGTDSAQAMFSGDISDCWISLSSTNAGFFYGALNNFTVQNCTFESAKCCFFLTGVGNADIHFSNNVVYSSFDGFINAALDTSTKNMVTINGLNAYSFYRDALISLKNCTNWSMNNINLQGDPTYATTDIGLLDVKDSTNITLSNFTCSGTLHEVVRFDGAELKVSNGLIDTCVAGFYAYGSSVSTDLFVENVNVTGASIGSYWDQSSTQGGNIYIDNCIWLNAAGNHWATQGTPSYNIKISNSRFINAGYPSGSSSTRNLSFLTSGDVLVENSEIGRTSASAAANSYVDQAGSGDCTLMNCTFTDLAAPSTEIVTSTGPVKILGGLNNRYAQYYASAAPTTGTWKIGDKVFNTAPSVGTPKGWVCTVAGTPGTWVSEGNL